MALKERLQQVLLSADLSEQQQQVKELSLQLNIEITDCAAALVYLMQTELVQTPLNQNTLKKTSQTLIKPPIKMLRYRLDVGRKHQLSIEMLKICLVEESGVDYNNIGYIELYHDYCLVKLPNEMPADIFQHLQNVEINQQKLNIQRYSSKPVNKRNTIKNKRQNVYGSKKTVAN